MNNLLFSGTKNGSLKFFREQFRNLLLNYLMVWDIYILYQVKLRINTHLLTYFMNKFILSKSHPKYIDSYLLFLNIYCKINIECTTIHPQCQYNTSTN